MFFGILPSPLIALSLTGIFRNLKQGSSLFYHQIIVWTTGLSLGPFSGLTWCFPSKHFHLCHGLNPSRTETNPDFQPQAHMKTRTTYMKGCSKIHLGAPSTSHSLPYRCSSQFSSVSTWYFCQPTSVSQKLKVIRGFFLCWKTSWELFLIAILHLSLSVPICLPYPGSTQNPICPESAFLASCLELPSCSSSSYQLFNSHTFVLCIQNDL